jgi:hypothetical protein
MWKNIVKPGRPQMIIWHMHIECWIPKATNTLSEYVILIAFQLQQWLHEHTSMLCYTYIACPVIDETSHPTVAMFMPVSGYNHTFQT